MHPQLATAEETARWLRERVHGALVIDSRCVRPGDGFIAWSGRSTDARAYVDDALHAGAAACVVEHAGLAAHETRAWMRSLSAPVASYRGLKQDLGLIADAYHAHPSRRLDVVAVTGTNGKTSSACWIAQALSAVGRPCGVVGTLGAGRPGALSATAGLTTPDPVTLHGSLRRMADEGVAACAIEASSIGLAEHRLDGLQIAVAVFTNFTQDHLDFHGDMANYWRAKRRLFSWPGLRAAVVHLDASGQGRALAEELRAARQPRVLTTAIEAPADLIARSIRLQERAVRFELHAGGEQRTVHAPVVGLYNVANVLGVIGTVLALGVALDDAVRACAALEAVPGRMHVVPGPSDGPLVVVDYAHTPDALAQVLAALRPWAQARGGHLWCVFGCGGDRDAAKRPRMGAVAARLSDRVVLTSDNPRSENPLAILAQIRAGVDAGAVSEEVDRARAIAQAIAQADACDVILLAGKGHETTQELAGRRLPFSDLDAAAQALQTRGVQARNAGGRP